MFVSLTWTNGKRTPWRFYKKIRISGYCQLRRPDLLDVNASLIDEETNDS